MQDADQEGRLRIVSQHWDLSEVIYQTLWSDKGTCTYSEANFWFAKCSKEGEEFSETGKGAALMIVAVCSRFCAL